MKTNQDIVLFNIARSRKQISVGEIVSLSGKSLTKKQVEQGIDSLKRRKLINRSNKEEKIARYVLNLKQLKRIKNILNEHWENKWEEDWNVVKN